MKRLFRENLPSLLLAVCFLLLVPWVLARSDDPLPEGLEQWKTKRMDLEAADESEIPKIKLLIKNSTSTYYPKNESGSYWSVSFEQARVESEERMEMIRPMVCIIDPEQEYGAMVIRGGEGDCLTNGQFIEIRNNVRTRTYDGDYLETENLCYDAQKDLIYSEGPYVLTRKGNVLRGVGISTDPKMTSIKFGNPTGQLDVRNIRKQGSEATAK